ncbi:unnamed protein product [Closterium sp. NIES-53]
MASLNVLTFDAEGRAVDFEVWLDDLQLFLQCDSKDGLSLFDLTYGASTAPTADADSTVRSQWLTRDAAARLAVRNHLPSTERAHFSQYKSARALYDAVVARYSSPTTAALSRLMLPYLFPDLAAFSTVADLVAHLRTSDAHYRAALPTEFLPTNSPPMYITLYYLVTRLPDSLSSVRDQFLSLCPTELSVNLLEERLAAAKKSILAVGASRGDRRTPFFEGCSPVPLPPSVASAAAVDLVGTEEVGAASAPSGRCRTGKGKGSKGGGGGGGGSGGGGGGSGGGGPEGGDVGGGGGGRGGGGGGGGGGGSGAGGSGGRGASRGAATQRGGLGGGQRQQQLRTRETLSVQHPREWYAGRGRSGGAGPSAYVLRTGTRSGEVCGLPHTTQRCFGRLTDVWRTQFPDAVELPRWHDLLLQNVPIFDLEFDAILAAMYALADITEGDYYLRVPSDPGTVAAALGASAAAALGASASAAPGAGTSPPSDTAPTESFHTFTLDSGASRSFFRDSTTLTPLRRPVAVSLADPSGGPVLAHSSTVLPCPAAPSGLLSGLHLPSFSTNLVSGADLQDAWVDQFTPGGQRVTHCTCSWTGRHLATFTRQPGSSLYTRTTAPPPSGQVAASSQVFAAASRSSPASAPCSCRPLAHETLLWHHCLGHPSQPRLRGMASRALGHECYFLLVVDDYSRYTTVFPLRCKDRDGEFSSDLMRAFCRLEGIRQTFTLPASPLQNGIAERRIGMVMDVAPDKLSSRAVPCVFLGFPPDAPGWQFYYPSLRRVLSSQNVTFDESVSYYCLFPHRTASPPPPAALHRPRSSPGAARGAETGGAESGGTHMHRPGSFSASASRTPRHSPLLCLPVTRSQLHLRTSPLLARFVAPGRHRKVHWDAAKRVLRYLCTTSGMGLVLGGRARVVLTGHADASWIYAGAMAAQEFRWLTYLLTDLGEAPRSPPALYIDNKAMLALCQEHRLEHRTKHIALRYFLARELQQRGQLRLAYVASQANTADVFTKALQSCDHQPCFAFLDWSCDLLFSPTLPMGRWEGGDLQPCAPCCPAALRALRALQPCAPRAPCCPAPLQPCAPCCPVCLVHPAALQPCAPCCPAAAATALAAALRALQPYCAPCALLPCAPRASCSPVRPARPAVLLPCAPCAHCSPARPARPAALQPCAPRCPVFPARPAALLPCAPRAPCSPVRPARPAALRAPRTLLPCSPVRPAALLLPLQPLLLPLQPLLLPCAPRAPCSPAAPRAPCSPARPAHPAVLLPCAPCAHCSPAHPARPAALQPCAPCCPAALCALLPCLPRAPCCPAALCAPRALQPCAPCCPAALCALLPCAPCAPCCPLHAPCTAPPPPLSPPSPAAGAAVGGGYGGGGCVNGPLILLLLRLPLLQLPLRGSGDTAPVATVRAAPVARVSAASADASYLLSSHSPASSSSSSLALCERL